MNLPAVLDIAIGLIFIYLILSLLASEIQELISTLLQWRAVHLKQSIEGLLAANGEESEDLAKVRDLANKIYDNPYISSLNQSAKGFTESKLRDINHLIGRIVRRGQDGIFGEGKNSGPSFLNARTFIDSLWETLQFRPLTQQLAKIRLETFINKEILDKYGRDVFSQLEVDKVAIIRDFETGRESLANTVEIIAQSVQAVDQYAFLEIFGDPDNSDSFAKRREILLRKLQPNPTEIIQLILIYKDPTISKRCQDIYEKLGGQGTYEEIKQEIKLLPPLPEHVEQCLLFYASLRTNDEIKRIVRSLPPLPEPLQQNLYLLAKRSQTTVTNIENQFNQFQTEAESWFDRSMERASGVYKRNAKLVAIILGFIVAVAANADSLYIVDKLSKDQTLRSGITHAVEGIVTENPQNPDVAKINAIAQNISLPIGWDDFNIEQQQKVNGKWFLFGIQIPPLIVNLVGWFISALAISMGASFWYDILSKFINIKNVGKQPTAPDKETPKS